jgi:hypothetical protein
MLSAIEDPVAGLVICEGTETGIALHQAELRPVWALGGAGNLAVFPVLAGIECLTIAADRDSAGIEAAQKCAERWRRSRRQVRIITPPAGDWASDQ